MTNRQVAQDSGSGVGSNAIRCVRVDFMGRGFGRGAKAVAIVTHAQTRRGAKKLPRGLRGAKKHKRERRLAREEDPEEMLNTKVSQLDRSQGSIKALDAQIAAIHFKESVQGRGRLKHLRKQLVAEVTKLRQKHHDKRRKLNASSREEVVAAHNADKEKHVLKRHNVTRTSKQS